MFLKWRKYYPILVSTLLLGVTLAVVGLIWNNVKKIENRLYLERVNVASNIAETARVFIDKKQLADFYKMLQLLTRIPFVEGIAVYQGGVKRLYAGEQNALDHYTFEYRARPNQTSYVDAGSGRFFVKWKLDYLKDKEAHIITVFTLGEFLAAKKQIVVAIMVIVGLLVILLGMGMYLLDTKQKLHLMHQQLKETEQTKADMIYSITHDAKQDLTVIQGKLSSLLGKIKKGSDLPNLEKDLKNAKEGADSIDRFLNNLNDQQRLQSGEIEMLPETIDLVNAVLSVMQAVEEQMSNRGMRFRFQPPHAPCQVVADSQVVRRVLKNIIHNAIKFSPFDSHISIEMQCNHNAVKTSIRDQGPGIKPDDWEKIFLPYVQLQPKKEGMGLGLATSRKLVQLMGGELGIEQSTLEHGTTFYFTLPLFKK
ncbi:HAMP domain-containing histidine kinase [candidate division FCPU426 bacterium]|nr:HAMP domain-containing histidine kinase [candidate division FCPU426 bacterium]